MTTALRSGVDVIETARFETALERHGERLLQRLFTSNERSDCQGRTESLAARFAAKEAVAKALGTGIGPVTWREIEILRSPSGEPLLHLHGVAAQKAAELGLTVWSVSISHAGGIAVAIAVALGLAKSG